MPRRLQSLSACSGQGCRARRTNKTTPGKSRGRASIAALHDRALRAGLEELKHRDVRGKDVTSFLLDRFREETGGESLEVNKRIIRNNARLAARIAVALAALRAGERARS